MGMPVYVLRWSPFTLHDCATRMEMMIMFCALRQNPTDEAKAGRSLSAHPQQKPRANDGHDCEYIPYPPNAFFLLKP